MVHLVATANVGVGRAQGDQRLSAFELADDLRGCVADAFHGEVLRSVGLDEDFHSSWTDVRGQLAR